MTKRALLPPESPGVALKNQYCAIFVFDMIFKTAKTEVQFTRTEQIYRLANNYFKAREKIFCVFGAVDCRKIYSSDKEICKLHSDANCAKSVTNNGKTRN